MKIGMLTSIDEKCGISQYSRQLCEGLKSFAEIDIVPIHSRSEDWLTYITGSAAKINQCDVVHIQHEYSFWESILPGKNKFFAQMKSISRPKVITAHTLDTAAKMLDESSSGGAIKLAKNILKNIPSYTLTVEAGVFNTADKIIIHDNPSKRLLLGRGISERKIRVIPMGVPDPIDDPELGDSFRMKNDLFGKKLIVIFGFIRPGRGYEQMLEILPQLDNNTFLVIAGGPQNASMEYYLNDLYELIRKFDLSKRTLITGYLNEFDAGGAIQSADLILCSQESGTGSYSVQMALGYGKSILASDLPCFTELEKSYKCLATYKNGSRENMLQKIKSLIDDPDETKRLSLAASKYAIVNSWRKVAEKTFAVYKELHD